MTQKTYWTIINLNLSQYAEFLIARGHCHFCPFQSLNFSSCWTWACAGNFESSKISPFCKLINLIANVLIQYMSYKLNVFFKFECDTMPLLEVLNHLHYRRGWNFRKFKKSSENLFYMIQKKQLICNIVELQRFQLQ